MSRHRPLLLPLIAALAGIAATGGLQAAEPLHPTGPIHVLHGIDPCPEVLADVAPLGGGGFFVVWQDRGGGGSFGGRRLDPAGTPIDQEVTLWVVPPTATDPVGRPRIATGADGGFVVAWVYSDVLFFEQRLMVQAFDADGTPRGEPVVAGTASPTYITELALATDDQGRPALAWASEPFVWLRLFNADLTPRTGQIEVALGGGDPSRVAGRPAVAADFDGQVLVAWEEAPGAVVPRRFERIRGRLFDAGGNPGGDTFEIHESPSGGVERSLHPTAEALAGGGWVVAWAGLPGNALGERIEARRLDELGTPLGEAFRVDDQAQRETHEPDVAALADGSFAVVWGTWLWSPPIDPPPAGHDRIRVALLRHFDGSGAPLDLPIELGPAEVDRWQTQPAVAAAPDALRLVAVWRYHDPPLIVCGEVSEIRARAFGPGCTETGDRLCLQHGRFGVEVLLTDPRLAPPIPRLAGAERLTEDTGTFWFFRPANVELMTKVIDARGLDGRFWFFSGALTDLGHEIVVLDHQTGIERRYVNRPGELVSRADTGSFPDVGSAGSAAFSAPAPAQAAPGTVPPACEDPHELCLQDFERIRVRIAWHDPRSGDSGDGFAERLTAESGWFWFFRPGNAEVVVKVLDGAEVNGFWWVFVGGLTDLELEVTVEDLINDAAWTYHKPPFVLDSHADTAALFALPLPP